jgi:hypothetical protein
VLLQPPAHFLESAGMQPGEARRCGPCSPREEFCDAPRTQRAARQRRIRDRSLAGDAQTLIKRAAPVMNLRCHGCEITLQTAALLGPQCRSQNSHGSHIHGKSRRKCGLRVRKMRVQETTHRDCHDSPRFQTKSPTPRFADPLAGARGRTDITLRSGCS